MSRPNGPVRHPGLAGQQETQQHSEAYTDPYAQAPTDHVTTGAPGQPVPPQQPAHQPQQNYAQPAPADGYQQPHVHTPDPGGAAYQQPQPAQPSQASWADLNQPPVQQPAHQPNSGYQDPRGYGQDAMSNEAAHGQAPQYPNAAGNAHASAPSYDPAYAQQQSAPPQPNYPQPNTAPQYSAPMPSTTPSAAPSGYDFASYDAPQPAPQLDTGFQSQQDTAVNWGQPDLTGAAAGADFGLTTQTSELDPHQQPVHVDDAYAGEDDEYEYEDEEYGGRGKGTLIAAALAGAIVVGGSMAYGYQSIFGGGGTDKPPVVRGTASPAKVKPADPGGRIFAHKDKAIMDTKRTGRLQPRSGQSNDPAGGARRVSTMRIGRDGSVMPPGNPVASGSGQRMVTGMTLGATAPTAAAAQPSPSTAAKTAPIVVKPPVETAAVNVAKAAVTPVKPVAPKVSAPVKPVVKAAPKPAPKKVAVAKPAAAPVVTAPKPTGAGYVAVLASIPKSNSSRMDALKRFADLQQKYGTVLQNKTPDVQTANLGDKGTYHRLIAGPPGSSQSARAVCSELKTAGYPSCWVLAY